LYLGKRERKDLARVSTQSSALENAQKTVQSGVGYKVNERISQILLGLEIDGEVKEINARSIEILMKLRQK
jgi:hypothetical protein